MPKADVMTDLPSSTLLDFIHYKFLVIYTEKKSAYAGHFLLSIT